MGQVKDQFKPTPEQISMSQERKAKLLEKIGLKKKNHKLPTESEVEQASQTVRDKLIEIDESLKALVQVKLNDLLSEKDDAKYNNRALYILETMQFHIETTIDLAEKYANLRESFKK